MTNTITNIKKSIALLENKPTLSNTEAYQLSILKGLTKHHNDTIKINTIVREKELRFFFTKEEHNWFHIIMGQTIAQYLCDNPPLRTITTTDNGYQIRHIVTYIKICKVLKKNWRYTPKEKKNKIQKELLDGNKKKSYALQQMERRERDNG